MSAPFDFQLAPFDRLTQEQQQRVAQGAQWLRFGAGETIVAQGGAPTQLFVLREGRVVQHEDAQVVASLAPGACFDGRGLLAGRSSASFVAAADVCVHAIDRSVVGDLMAANAGFAALLLSDVAARLGVPGLQAGSQDLQSLNLARVGHAPLRPAPVVDAVTDIVTVVRLLQQRGCSQVLVRDAANVPPRLGMFTATALQQAVLAGGPLERLAVGRFANYPLVTLTADDQIGDALVLMLRHDIHRVVVMDGDAVAGVLESLDLFSFLSDHSHLIARRIGQAGDLDELALAAGQITAMIARQFHAGTRVALIASLVRELNAQLFDRLWRLVAPAELVRNSCLFVMGSEGRGEQLLKTDQDNGLILRDSWQPDADLGPICERFSQGLARLGYPECPGHIMLSNPLWRASAAEFATRVRRWLLLPEGDSLMNLAIFLDAHAVSGDASLLRGVRDGLAQLVTDNEVVLARFAAAVDAFGGRSGWWNRLLGDTGQRMNLKKEGIFALVHGVRSLALAQRLPDTGTQARIEALVRAGALAQGDGRELVAALHFLMELRLKAGLAELDSGQPVSGAVDVAALPAYERERLKGALATVRKFKAMLRQRFRLDAL